MRKYVLKLAARRYRALQKLRQEPRQKPRQRPSRCAPRLLLIALSLCWQSADVRAWGALGHEIAGTLAEPYLNASARQRIRLLLGDESLAEASTWADRMRSDPAPFWQHEAGPYHYVTVPPGKHYREIGAPDEGDAVSALAMFRRQLQNPDIAKPQQQLALRFALHIIQDLQQPLHVGNGRDRGGNEIFLRVNGKPSNLHRVWDSQILYSARRSRSQWQRHLADSGLLRDIRPEDADPMQWIVESAALRDSLYPPPRSINDSYLARELPRAEARLALAAIRSAAWMNQTFSGTARPPDPAASGDRPVPDKRRWWQRLLGR
jgi:hypothetical protein